MGEQCPEGGAYEGAAKVIDAAIDNL